MVFPAYGNGSWTGNGENALYVIGQTSFAGTTAHTTQTGLSKPWGVKVDVGNSLLYVADINNNRVMVFPAYGNANWTGTGESALYEIGQPSGGTAFTTATAARTQSGLSNPVSLDIDTVNNRLFVSDAANGRVMVFPTPVTSNGENASFVLGEPNFTSNAYNSCCGAPGATGFQGYSGGPIYDSTNNLLYVADWGSGNGGDNRVLIFNVHPTALTPSSPTQSGYDGCAIAGGQLYCWGYNVDGEDGTGNSTEYQIPVQVGSAANWTTISQGDRTFDPAACGIAGGNLYCWGENTYGELGLGNTTPYNTPQQITSPSASWSSVSTSGNDTCAITTTGALYCWGRNQYGELGIGSTSQQTSPQQVTSPSTTWSSVSTGGTDTCAITTGGALYCWGRNQYGEDGNSVTSNTVFVTSTTTTGDIISGADTGLTAANDICAARATAGGLSGTYVAWLATTTASSPLDTYVQSIFPYEEVGGTVVASNWTGLISGTLTNGITLNESGVAVTAGDVWTNVASGGGASTNSASSATKNCSGWTNNSSPVGSHGGDFGLTGSTTSAWTASSNVACNSTNYLYCFQQNANPTQQTTPVQVGSATNWIAVSQGSYDTCGIRGSSGSGALYCWGENKYGEVGQGNTLVYGTPTATGASISTTGWTAVTVQYDGTNDGEACGIASGALYCWGRNHRGEDGNGNTTQATSPTQVGALTTWTSVSFGDYDVCGIAGSTLYCWGYNNNYESGVGNNTDNETPQAVGGLDTIGNGESASDLMGQYSSPSSTATVEWYQQGYNNGATALGLYEPSGVALDSVNHALYVGDGYNARVLVYNLNTDNSIPTSSGGHTASYTIGTTALQGNTAASSSISWTGGLALDAANNRLFVADSYRALVYVFPTPVTSNGENASANLVGCEYCATPTAASMHSYGVEGIAYDPVNENLYVADSQNNRVMIIYIPPGFANGLNASYEFGQPSGGTQFTTATAATSQSGMSVPTALAYDQVNQRLFVADTTNNRVLVFSTASLSDGPNATNVIGQASFTTATVGHSQTGLYSPCGLAYDANNNRLFVSDGGNNRIMVYNAGPSVLPTFSASATNVLGQTNFTNQGSATTQSGLFLGINNCGNPGDQNLQYDPGSGRLFVIDNQNNRIMIFDANFANPNFFQLMPD